MVIPNHHYEDIYSISEEALYEVYRVVQKVVLAIRSTYDGCTATSTRQHNEPDGNQSVWHFHAHVFPRYKDDDLYKNHDNKTYVSPAERKKYADILKAYFCTH
jgi:histidine triad (HIT) family protein